MPSCYQTATYCTNGPQPGALGLMDAILFVWGDEGASSWGIFNCRNTNTPGGSSQKSVHAQGRAGDVRTPWNGKVGYTIAEALAKAASVLHVQFVIWAKKKWGCSYSPVGQKHKDWLGYGGYDHFDHVHWELNWTGAKMTREAMRKAALKAFGQPSEDEMTPDQEAKLDRAIELSEKALGAAVVIGEALKDVLDSVGKRYKGGPTLQSSLVIAIDHDGDPNTPRKFMEHLGVLQDIVQSGKGDLEKRLVRIEDALSKPDNPNG